MPLSKTDTCNLVRSDLRRVYDIESCVRNYEPIEPIEANEPVEAKKDGRDGRHRRPVNCIKEDKSRLIRYESRRRVRVLSNESKTDLKDDEPIIPFLNLNKRRRRALPMIAHELVSFVSHSKGAGNKLIMYGNKRCVFSGECDSVTHETLWNTISGHSSPFLNRDLADLDLESTDEQTQQSEHTQVTQVTQPSQQSVEAAIVPKPKKEQSKTQECWTLQVGPRKVKHAPPSVEREPVTNSPVSQTEQKQNDRDSHELPMEGKEVKHDRDYTDCFFSLSVRKQMRQIEEECAKEKEKEKEEETKEEEEATQSGRDSH